MLDRAGFLAFLCYEAMFGSKYDFTGITSIGTNEDMLIRVLLSVNRDNDGVKQVLSEYDDAFDVGWKEDLQRLAHLPDIEDIKCAYPRLDALGFDCNAGNEETKADAAEKWDRINNGYRGSNPYERDGTFYFCAKEPRDGWEEAAMGGGRKVWKVGTNFFVAKEPEYANWEEYDLPKTQKVWKVPMGKTLADAIRSDTSFDFKDMLIWLLKDKDVGAAEAINEAFGDTFICKDVIMGVMASRSNSMRTEIAIKYERLYGNADYKRGCGMRLSKLKEDISEKLDGDFADVCRDMFQDGDERCADYCFLAMHGHNKDDDLAAKGIEIDESKQEHVGGQVESVFRTGMLGSMGTDEARLDRTILFSSKSELKGLIEAYRSKFGGWEESQGMEAEEGSEGGRYNPAKQVEGVGPTLYDDVYKEVGGDHRRLLMYRFRQATSGMMHVPRPKLTRCDDMPSNFPIDAIAKYDVL